MKRRTSTLPVLLLSALLAGCSGGGGGAASSASPSESASPSPSPSPSPPPVDVAVAGPAAANKINLQATDLPPGFATSPPANTDSADALAREKETAKCIGMPFVEPVVSEVSDDFIKGSEFPSLEYASQVEFYGDEATVAADLVVFQGVKIGECLAKLIKEDLSTEADGFTFTPVVVTRLTPTAAGSDGAFGLRLSTMGRSQGQTIPFTFDALGFVKDRTEVSLTVLAVGTKVNDVERDALFAKLVERGVANAL